MKIVSALRRQTSMNTGLVDDDNVNVVGKLESFLITVPLDVVNVIVLELPSLYNSNVSLPIPTGITSDAYAGSPGKFEKNTELLVLNRQI